MGLAGFSSTTVWLVFGAFIFALGYEATGLGRRIALFPVKFMGKRTLTLGYAVVIIDILLAPFTPSNTARTGGTVFPVVKTCRRCSIPSPTILFTPHRRLPDVDDGGRHQHQLLDVRHRRRAERAGHRVRRQDRRGAHQLDAVVLAFLPVGLLLLIIAPLISYYLYKPGVTHSSEVAARADTALGKWAS